MNWREYSELAIQTAVYPNKSYNVAYPVLGLIGELGEWERTGYSDPKEAGDVFWYINATAFELGSSLYDLAGYTLAGKYDEPFLKYLSPLAEMAKKAIRDNNGLAQENKIHESIINLAHVLRLVIDKVGVKDVNKILQLNIDKLFDRMDRGVLEGDGDNR